MGRYLREASIYSHNSIAKFACSLCLLPAPGSVAQRTLGISDAVEDFRGDVSQSCGGLINPALVEVLVHGSTQADAFLRSLGVELDAVSQCGGHTVPRTHRFAPKDGKAPPPVGFGIMSTLEKLVRERFADCE